MSSPLSRSYDVAVAGAGPGGSLAAYRLALRGYRVLLLERERLPRYKVCGGGVTRKALAEIPFDVADVLEQAPTIAEITTRGARSRLVHTPDVAAWTAMRDSFDERLTRAAVETGVTLVEECRAMAVTDGRLETDRGPVDARYIVGADGAPSRIAQSLGLVQGRRQTPAIEAEVDVPEETVRRYAETVVFDFSATPGGYGWIFPKKDHLSMGLCSLEGKAEGLREQTVAYVGKLLGDVPWKMRSIKGHLLAIGGPIGKVHAGNTVLVGDAAGLIDPFLGEGIYYALRSARAAAEAVDAVLSGSVADLSPYSKEIQQLFGQEFHRADQLGRFIFKHPDLSHRLFIENRRIARLFVDVVSGDRTYRGFLRACFSNPFAVLAGYFQPA